MCVIGNREGNYGIEAWPALKEDIRIWLCKARATELKVSFVVPRPAVQTLLRVCDSDKRARDNYS